MNKGCEILLWCLVLFLVLMFFFIEKVLFPMTDILSDFAFAVQLIEVTPLHINDRWKGYFIYNGSVTPWKHDAAKILNAYGQAMFFPIILSLISLLPHLWKKEACIRTKIFEFFLVLLQFYPQYIAMKLIFEVARNNNPWKNQDGKFSKDEWHMKKERFEKEVGCNEAILEALLQFNFVIVGGRIFLGIQNKCHIVSHTL